MNSEVVMPFGKYKGQAVRTVPKNYLRWALANLTFKDSRLKAAVAAVVGGKPVPAPEPGPDEQLAAVMAIVGSNYRVGQVADE